MASFSRDKRLTLFPGRSVGLEEQPLQMACVGFSAPVPAHLCWIGGPTIKLRPDHGGSCMNKLENLTFCCCSKWILKEGVT